jgi:xylan 1,4-beta-xylosidase
LGDERLLVDGLHDTVDAWIFRNEHQLTVMLTNHVLPRHAIHAQSVHVQLTNAPRPIAVTTQRIDDSNANAKRLWHELGEPQYLNSAMLEQLRAASSLTSETHSCTYSDRTIDLDVDLPAHAVAAVTLELATR